MKVQRKAVLSMERPIKLNLLNVIIILVLSVFWDDFIAMRWNEGIENHGINGFMILTNLEKFSINNSSKVRNSNKIQNQLDHKINYFSTLQFFSKCHQTLPTISPSLIFAEAQSTNNRTYKKKGTFIDFIKSTKKNENDDTDNKNVNKKKLAENNEDNSLIYRNNNIYNINNARYVFQEVQKSSTQKVIFNKTKTKIKRTPSLVTPQQKTNYNTKNSIEINFKTNYQIQTIKQQQQQNFQTKTPQKTHPQTKPLRQILKNQNLRKTKLNKATTKFNKKDARKTNKRSHNKNNKSNILGNNSHDNKTHNQNFHNPNNDPNNKNKTNKNKTNKNNGKTNTTKKNNQNNLNSSTKKNDNYNNTNNNSAGYLFSPQEPQRYLMEGDIALTLKQHRY